ncbi:MAG TPA: HupE/UreJ family protein [Candidatus Limnocylindrales bacterium]|nr:HupE/UreJ family protein [Candidatus Limnocylindrales bacterium]
MTGAGGAAAHERSVSYSTWELSGDGAKITLRIGERELTRLPAAALPSPQREAGLAEAVASALRLHRSGQACLNGTPSFQHAAPRATVAVSWQARCAAATGMVAIESALAQTLAAPHHHFLRVVGEDGAAHEALLHAERPLWRQRSAAPPATAVWARAFSLGLDHILSGYDHLAFVAGLLLAATMLSQVAATVTGFTAAHSITLALATLGWVRPAGAGVEVMIAFSIAVLAVENLTVATAPRASGAAIRTIVLLLLPAAALATLADAAISPVLPLGMALFSGCYLALVARSPMATRLRWLVAFAFGLLHGFGFAGALVEAEYSRATLATTLIGFNLGVEAGQLLVVALLWPLIALMRRRLQRRYDRVVLEPASTALLAASTCWYLTRAFG